MRPCVRSPAVATGLWPVRSTSKLFEERLTELWLQDTYLFATCAAKSKQSGGQTRKMWSTRFDGSHDIAAKAPRLHQTNQKVSGGNYPNRAKMFLTPDQTSRQTRAPVY